MEQGIVIELAVAGITILVSLAAGWWVERGTGAFFFGIGAVLASVLTVGGTYLGFSQWGSRGGWIGLIAAVLLVAALARVAVSVVLMGLKGSFVAGIWLGYCSFCIAGYLAGDWIGLITITIPALAVFWIGLFRVSAYVLPLRDWELRPELRLRPRHPPGDRPQISLLPLPGIRARLRSYLQSMRASHWGQAFRCLLTLAMGTNYPYFSLKGGKLETMVSGNSFNRFLAGPGLVLADCDQAAYLTDGIHVKAVLEPGLNFTGWLDQEPRAMDLRVQLRSFSIEALTKDGIRIQTLVHAAFRIQPGRRCTGPYAPTADCEPELGKAFPFRRRSVYQIAAAEPVERGAGREQGEKRQRWDTELVPAVATRILQDVVSGYDLDELCAALDPDRMPLEEIWNDFQRRLHQALQPLGIQLVESWLDNLKPADEKVTERRLDNWRTEWERRILQLTSEGKAERAREIERARAQAELRILLRFCQVIKATPVTNQASQTALALRFIDSLGEVVGESEGQWPLSESSLETLQQLRGEIEAGRR